MNETLNLLKSKALIQVLLLGVWSLMSGSAFAQCANFGVFDIGEDVEITCEDSCLTLNSPSVATIASGGSEYEVEEIDYDLPYPFTQGSIAISTGDDDGAVATNVPIGFSFNYFGQNYTQCRISPNGWVSFNLNEGAPYNPPGNNPNNINENVASPTSKRRPNTKHKQAYHNKCNKRG